MNTIYVLRCGGRKKKKKKKRKEKREKKRISQERSDKIRNK